MKHNHLAIAALALLLDTGSPVTAADDYGSGYQTGARPFGLMGQPGPIMSRGMGGPGMMMDRGMGQPGMMGQSRGPGPTHNLTPYQRQQHWEQMDPQGYGPGSMPAPFTK